MEKRFISLALDSALFGFLESLICGSGSTDLELLTFR